MLQYLSVYQYSIEACLLRAPHSTRTIQHRQVYRLEVLGAWTVMLCKVSVPLRTLTLE